MSAADANTQWAEFQQAAFLSRSGAALAFWPELKRALNELIEHEPFKGHVKIHTSEEYPYLLTVSAGLFDLKFAADVMSDIIFYAFTSAALKRIIPRDSAIFHRGVLRVSKGYWGLIDNVGPDVHKIFAENPEAVRHFSLADQVARYCLEKLLGGYPVIAELADDAKAKEEAAKKEAKRDSSRE